MAQALSPKGSTKSHLDPLPTQISTQRQRRLRTLTEVGQLTYNAKVSDFIFDKLRLTAALNQELEILRTCDRQTLDIRGLRNRIRRLINDYQALSTEFFSYLDQVHTRDSEKEKSKHIDSAERLYDRVDAALEFVNQMLSRTPSHQSSHGKHSSHSISSSQIAKQKAKVEAALTSINYAEKEIELEKQQAELVEMELKAKATLERRTKNLQSDLTLLNKRKEAAIAKAELDVLYESSSSTKSFRTKSDTVNEADIMERTRNYVFQQSTLATEKHSPVDQTTPKLIDIPAPFIYDEDIQIPQPEIYQISKPSHRATEYGNHHTNGNQIPDTTGNYENNYFPSWHQSTKDNRFNPPLQTLQTQNQLPDLAKFLLKKDLLLSRLTSFNEKPESYLAWKTSFKSVMYDLEVTPSEEIDMLVKWLGPESTKYANSIRSSNVRNPQNGLLRIWERLDERYGSPQMVETSLKTKLEHFSKLSVKDNKRLYDLLDILAEIQSAKEDDQYTALLSYFDTSSGVSPIVNKLPYALQNKWTYTAKKYMNNYHVPFPPFSVFVNFIRELSSTLNDPSFNYSQEKEMSTTIPNQSKNFRPKPISVKKTEFGETSTFTETKKQELCPLHKTKHQLNECKGFRSKTLSDRKQFLHENKICFRCCSSHSHLFRSCKEPVKCTDCGSDRHPTALHVNQSDTTTNSTTTPAKTHGGEEAKDQVTSKCTQICGKFFNGRSCAKITLSKIYDVHQPEKCIQAYVVHDDQSNQTLGNSKLFDYMNISHQQSQSYTLSTCAGTQSMSGRVATGFIIESLDGTSKMELPIIIECNEIPDNRDEIPSPTIAAHHPHLADIAKYIPPVKEDAPILLLIGRDLPEAHHVLQQHTGPKHSPFAQKLNLGWVIVGEVCLGRQHRPNVVNVNKTYILNDGRTSTFPECPNNLQLKPSSYPYPELQICSTDTLGSSVFEKTKDDERIGTSIEDKTFIKIMDNEFIKDPGGYWSAPLPFKNPRPRLPNNKPQAVKRSRTLDYSLKKDPRKREHFVTFMKNIFDNRHAEIAPPVQKDEECWYLPIFGVYHPNKPDQIRGVFDSSAKYEGQSLNGILMSGPNLTNELLGVLLRFRKDPIAIMADIQQMFYCFFVKKEHRNFLRFLWYQNNDPDQPLIEYRMCVHVFGNSPSPAVATYGLRKTVENSNDDVIKFVEKDFYVDDGLASFPTHQQAIDLLQRTQQILKEQGNLRLHKIASNSEEVMNAFPTEDLAKDLKDLDLRKDILPVQRSLGLCWDLSSDTFTYRLSNFNKPITRRGTLSTVNSLYDPLGFIGPVVIQGKVLLRNLISGTTDWDEPLPTNKISEWLQWESSLIHLQNLNIQRSYIPTSYSEADTHELHIYCDASEKAIAAVAYLKTYDRDDQIHIGFVLGKTKVAPTHGHSIPRLELCAAVLATEVAEIISHQMDITPNQTRFYSDSRVVLGYIYNQSRRFYIYVGNRVDRIRRFSKPDQWSYISTDKNPADQGTRYMTAQDLQGITWLTGPDSLRNVNPLHENQDFSLINPQEDAELRPLLDVKKTAVKTSDKLGTHRFSDQWSYISTDKNPADQGTRYMTAQDLQGITWLTGPDSLRNVNPLHENQDFSLINPQEDAELRPLLDVKKTAVKTSDKLGTHRFSRFSTWKSLVEAISHLIHLVQSFQSKPTSCQHWHSCQQYKTVASYHEAEILVIKAVQQEYYGEEIQCIHDRKPLRRNSSIISLTPVLDSDGLLRVGGRLTKSTLPPDEKNPIIIPGKHHISTLLIRHFHESVQHQGRHLTEGAVRSNGYWITGAKRLINSLIQHCMKCKRLRGTIVPQIMSDLPTDRLLPSPPFTYVGLDVFGPWQIVTRRTRGGQANSKRWAILFTCLVTRCIHLELIEEMSTSSCVNALRRFVALRGPVKEFRSDRGSNFIGSTNPLHIDAINVEDAPVKEFLYNSGVVWKFNSPHSSHMGGVWERMIGIVRRILDSILLDNKYKNLTHEVLSTLMAEVSSIVNSRPITSVSTDPESPQILTPSVLLTQKTNLPTNFFEDLDIRDMYKSQWKYVQILAEQFWKQFQRQYLPTLQPKTKWFNKQPNLKVNDVVLLKDKNLHRNDWSTGLILNVFPDDDGIVRKVEVRTIRDGKPFAYTRPISEIIPLLSDNL